MPTDTNADLPRWLAADPDLAERVTAPSPDNATTSGPPDPTTVNPELLPEDADDHTDGLTRILGRIPPRWGRWIACGPGWHQLLVELDTTLARIEPGYEVHQIKEKFGGLRYYTGLPDLACCAAVDAQVDAQFPPRPDPYDDRDGYIAWHDTHGQAWGDAFEAAHSHHADDPTHQQTAGRRADNEALLADVIAAAERQAARTCEMTGAPGVLMRDGHWLRSVSPLVATGDTRVIGIDRDRLLHQIREAMADDPQQLAGLVTQLADRVDDLAAVVQHVVDQQPAGPT